MPHARTFCIFPAARAAAWLADLRDRCDRGRSAAGRAALGAGRRRSGWLLVGMPFGYVFGAAFRPCCRPLMMVVGSSLAARPGRSMPGLVGLLCGHRLRAVFPSRRGCERARRAGLFRAESADVPRAVAYMLVAGVPERADTSETGNEAVQERSGTDRRRERGDQEALSQRLAGGRRRHAHARRPHHHRRQYRRLSRPHGGVRRGDRDRPLDHRSRRQGHRDHRRGAPSASA